MPEGQVLPLGAILLFAHLLFAHPPVFAFETSSIFWMVVTWACSLGGGHYGLFFMLQLKRKQGFIWVCCNQVSLSFKSGKMPILIFIERCSAWSSIFLVFSVCSCSLCSSLPHPTSVWGAEDVSRGLGHAEPMFHRWAAPPVPAIWFPRKTLRSLPARVLVILHPYRADNGIQKSGYKGKS